MTRRFGWQVTVPGVGVRRLEELTLEHHDAINAALEDGTLTRAALFAGELTAKEAREATAGLRQHEALLRAAAVYEELRPAIREAKRQAYRDRKAARKRKPRRPPEGRPAAGPVTVTDADGTSRKQAARPARRSDAPNGQRFKAPTGPLHGKPRRKVK